MRLAQTLGCPDFVMLEVSVSLAAAVKGLLELEARPFRIATPGETC